MNEDVKYLEKLHEARVKVNELTGMAHDGEEWKLLSEAYEILDRLLSPVCRECKVRARRFITSPAQLYDPAMAELPGGSRSYWTGEWFCPQCRHMVAHGEKWWEVMKP